jgi:hypothetical protein
VAQIVYHAVNLLYHGSRQYLDFDAYLEVRSWADTYIEPEFLDRCAAWQCFAEGAVASAASNPGDAVARVYYTPHLVNPSLQ